MHTTRVTNGEPVIAVIPNATLKTGLLGGKSRQYTIVLTQRRMVLAQITTQMMKQLVADARDGAKADGKGFFGQWGAQLAAYSRFAESYLEMPPEQALAETAGNFAIERSTIKKVKLKTGYEDVDTGASKSDSLVIKTADKTYTIALPGGSGQAKHALKAAGMV